MKKAVWIAAWVAASLQIAQAGVITAWTFENDAIAVNNTPAPSTGSGTASSIGMATYATPNIGVTTDDIDQGATSDTGTNNNADVTQIWRIRAQAGTAGAANGWSSAAPIGSQGAVFAVSTAGDSGPITVSFDWYATTQGEGKLQFEYTTDGKTWTNLPITPGPSDGSASGLAIMTNTASANTVMGSYAVMSAGQNWYPGLTVTISDPAAANNPNFAVEMVNASTGADCVNTSGMALNNSSGNWRFDNVIISAGAPVTTTMGNGNLVLSRSVYMGDASTVTVGQALPPVCPASAAAASQTCQNKAVSNGQYPNTSNSNNVWNNDTADGSFGVTSPIFLDELNPTTGALISTMPIPTNMVNTSFSSKSELALNLSTDGSVLTFMAYVAPANTVDVSNSNSPLLYDPTNPSGNAYYRSVVQVGANGAIQVTPTNAYSGNNGRAAILSGGNYYMVGNSDNGAGPGSGTPNVVATTTGVEIATPGQAATTMPQQVGDYVFSASDKLGKDNNFRGLTIFNNTLYVSKGSGSNGANTVYQVGTAGTLPTLSTAASAPIAILPGFNTTSAKTATTGPNPFGLFFANATTLYVADEGDGIVPSDAAASKFAGLEKWTLANGTWTMDYVLQSGLNLGTQYSIPNYPSALYPSTGGLRNITGKVSADGTTVTIWAVTSTTSANGDQGADPNQLVMITDTLANTTAASAANEKFTILSTAPAGQVYRGVAFAPGSTTMPNVPLILSAGSPGVTTIPQGGIAFAMGQNMAPEADEVVGPFPTAYYGTTVTITDSKGAMTLAPLAFVSPQQITFQVPVGVATGSATVTISSPNGTQTAGNIQIAAVSPAVFTVDGLGVTAAYATRVTSSGSQIIEPAFALNAQGYYSPTPINMGAATDAVYLAFYTTGAAAAGSANITVTVNGVNCQLYYAGASGYTGIDQIDVLLPHSLAGSGTVELQVTAGTQMANGTAIDIQ